MAQTLLQVQRQIEQLRKTEAALMKAESAGVIARMKQAIEAYGFKPEDLFGGGSSPAPKTPNGSGNVKAPAPAKTTTKAKGKAARKAQFADDQGNEWVGRGPRPAWLRLELEAGKSLSDFAVKRRRAKAVSRVTATSAAPAASGTNASKASTKPKRKQNISVKYRDDKGNEWTGRGWKPLWLKTAIEGGKSLEDFAV